MKDPRGHWYLLTGIIIGIILGLIYSLLINPVQYVDTAPVSLSNSDKASYRSMIALAYQANGNLARAKFRLALLNEPDVISKMGEQAQQLTSSGGSQKEAQALQELAIALAVQVADPPTLATAPIPTSATATTLPQATPSSQGNSLTTPLVAATITPTSTQIPTPTPTPTIGPPFVFQEMTKVCDSEIKAPLLQVQALDSTNQPAPGVEVIVTWADGEDHFFTGMKPELGLGYADFTMQPDVKYTVRLADSGQPVTDLSTIPCDTPAKLGGWILTFKQP